MHEDEAKCFNYYAESIPYLIEKTSVYMHLQASALLNDLGADLTLDQFLALETIAFNPGICQRDLSKIVLKDRSNITRIMNILEKKALIERNLSSKNNRPVKTMILTEKGQDVIKKCSDDMRKNCNEFISQFNKKDIEALKGILNSMIEIISKQNNIQI